MSRDADAEQSTRKPGARTTSAVACRTRWTDHSDLAASVRLRPSLPAGALTVAESGISRRADVERLAAAGFDAFLVGESLLVADDPAAKLRELLA